MMLYIFLAILVQLVVVSWIDIKFKRISNYWFILNYALAVVLYLALSESYPFSYEIFFFPVGFIIGGFLLFNLGIMGAGDSKYLSSLFILLPFSLHVVFFEKLLLATIVTGGLLLLFRVVKKFREIRAMIWAQHWRGIKAMLQSRFSFAPVILLAWLLLGTEIWN